MDTGLNKQSNRSLTMAEHQLNNYNDSNFAVLSKAHNEYHLSLLEYLSIVFRTNLCKQQYVYKSNLYKLL